MTGLLRSAADRTRETIFGDRRRATRAVLLGLATGMRTFTGIAAVSLSGRRTSDNVKGAFISRRPLQVMLGIAAGQELVMDKLLQMSDRRIPVSFAGRMVAAACSGALLAARRRSDRPAGTGSAGTGTDGTGTDGAGEAARSAAAEVGGAALLAVAAAVVPTVLGPLYRRGLARLFGTDAVGATLEDLTAVSAAWFAIRR